MVLRYALAALIGAALFLILGYLVYSAPGGAIRFGYWLADPFRRSVWLWALAGAAIGASLLYVSRR